MLSTEPGPAAVLDEGWIRAVLFDHAIDDWVDLGPDPIRRQYAGQVYADHVGAAYAAWKWRCDASGADVDSPPGPRNLPEALALEVAVGNWTDLMAALLTAGRAQGLLFAELAAGDERARRVFDRVGRDLAGHASLAFLELRRGEFVDRARAADGLDRLVPATAGLLSGTAAGARWRAQLTPLLADLGFERVLPA